MVDRICISVNNRCNLSCRYCHFREKGRIDVAPMNIYKILDNVQKYARQSFKIGFVGNGESFLDWPLLKSYIQYLEDYPNIHIYTITNGTIMLADKDLEFLEAHRVNVGFSLDGYQELHNKNRCNSFAQIIEHIEQYRKVTGHYPTFNATVGKESLKNTEKIIAFFKPFRSRVTFSRMIGRYGISLEEYRVFLDKVEKELFIRRGQKDCTMYGGKCGAGINNYFFSNGKVYYCGNCVDLMPVADSDISFEELEKISLEFDRNFCYKESL